MYLNYSFLDKSNIVLSIVLDESVISSLLNFKKVTDRVWTEETESNVRDYDIAGTVVFPGFIWMFPTFLFLEIYSHEGSFARTGSKERY